MSDLHQHLIEEMWSAVLEDSDFKPMIETWDRLCNETNAHDKDSYLALLKKLDKDFTRLEAAVQNSVRRRLADGPALLNSKDAVALIDANGRVAEANDAFQRLEVDLGTLQRELAELDLSEGQTGLVWSSPPSAPSRSLLALVPIDGEGGFPIAYMVQRLDVEWQDRFSPIIRDLFNLTSAELGILTEIYQGKESGEIAKSKHRSVHTVRKHTKSILAKVGVNSQRQMIRIISSILQFYDRGDDSIGHTDFRRATYAPQSGHVLEYCEYGQPDGQPVFLITPTVPPVPTEANLSNANRLGLRIIAPFRPGSAGTAPRHAKDGPEVIATDYQELISNLQLDNPVIAGYASGGLYACALASKLQTDCAGLITVDTGSPITRVERLFKMPSSSRRTFLLARFAPKLLYTPHKVFANDFSSGPEGERRVVEYFFDGHPHDLARVKTSEHFYRATRDLIAYSFEDVERLVADVTYWAQDWSQLVRRLPAEVPKHAVIGDQNRLFKAPDLMAWCKQQDWTCTVIPNEGQLLVFSQDSAIFELFKSTLTPGQNTP